MAWTETTRTKHRRDGLRYASDTTDAEWRVIEPHLPAAACCGRTREIDLRDVVDALFDIAQSGCQWRLLPKPYAAAAASTARYVTTSTSRNAGSPAVSGSTGVTP